MKIQLVSFLFFCGMIMSCSSSDDCNQSAWTGSYELESSDCGGMVISLSNTITITAGDTDSSILINGTEVQIDGCNAEDTTFGASYSLDGNTMNASFSVCSGTYLKV